MIAAGMSHPATVFAVEMFAAEFRERLVGIGSRVGLGCGDTGDVPRVVLFNVGRCGTPEDMSKTGSH